VSVQNPQWFKKQYQEPDTSVEFVHSQGIVYVICRHHLGSKKPYVRYLIVGYIFINDPTMATFESARKKFPGVVNKFVYSPCPVCKKLSARKLLLL